MKAPGLKWALRKKEHPGRPTTTLSLFLLGIVVHNSVVLGPTPVTMDYNSQEASVLPDANFLYVFERHQQALVVLLRHLVGKVSVTVVPRNSQNLGF